MKCPPHVADVTTYEPQYKVILSKNSLHSDVFHIEKRCRICHLPVIILSDKLLKIIDDENWEVEIEILGD